MHRDQGVCLLGATNEGEAQHGMYHQRDEYGVFSGQVCKQRMLARRTPSNRREFGRSEMFSINLHWLLGIGCVNAFENRNSFKRTILGSSPTHKYAGHGVLL